MATDACQRKLRLDCSVSTRRLDVWRSAHESYGNQLGREAHTLYSFVRRLARLLNVIFVSFLRRVGFSAIVSARRGKNRIEIGFRSIAPKKFPKRLSVANPKD